MRPIVTCAQVKDTLSEGLNPATVKLIPIPIPPCFHRRILEQFIFVMQDALCIAYMKITYKIVLCEPISRLEEQIRMVFFLCKTKRTFNSLLHIYTDVTPTMWFFVHLKNPNKLELSISNCKLIQHVLPLHTNIRPWS